MATVRAKRGRFEWVSSGGTAVVHADDFDLAAAANTDWPILFSGGGGDVWQGGGFGQKVFLNVDSAENGPGEWTATHLFTGLTPDMVYDVLFDTGVSGLGSRPQGVGVRVSGTTVVESAFDPTAGVFRRVLRPRATAPASGELSVTLFVDGTNLAGGFILTWTPYRLVLREAGVGPATNRGLDLGYPIDFVVGAPALRQSAARAIQRTGEERGTVGHVVRELRGEVRWIPAETGLTREGHPVSGWWSDDGWEGFLRYAWSGAPFTFYPDRDDPLTSYECTLAAPRPSAGATDPLYELEPDGSRKLPIALRTLAGPFLGY